MTSIKRIETIEISGNTKEEVKDLVDSYLKLGYKIEIDVSLSSKENDKYPYFAYVTIDQF